MIVRDFTFPEAIVRLMSGEKGRAAGEERLRLYVERIHREFDAMAGSLAADAKSILDIGCGLAGIDVLIGRHLGLREINLIDGDGTGTGSRKFRANNTPWQDVRLGAELVRANVPNVPVYMFPADSSAAFVDGAHISVDLIVSLKSWGHHYPVETYMALAQKSLKSRGRLILDIRRGTNGALVLERSGFRRLGQIYETEKHERFVFGR